MNFKAHINYITSKATKIFFKLRRFGLSKFNIETNYFHKLYNTIFVPIICYGSVIWAHKLRLDTYKNKLLSSQRLPLLT